MRPFIDHFTSEVITEIFVLHLSNPERNPSDSDGDTEFRLLHWISGNPNEQREIVICEELFGYQYSPTFFGVQLFRRIDVR